MEKVNPILPCFSPRLQAGAYGYDSAEEMAAMLESKLQLSDNDEDDASDEDSDDEECKPKLPYEQWKTKMIKQMEKEERQTAKEKETEEEGQKNADEKTTEEEKEERQKGKEKETEEEK